MLYQSGMDYRSGPVAPHFEFISLDKAQSNYPCKARGPSISSGRVVLEIDFVEFTDRERPTQRKPLAKSSDEQPTNRCSDSQHVAIAVAG